MWPQGPDWITDERRSPRENVILMATIEHGCARIPVRARNLSAHGALVIGDGLPAPETEVAFRCNGASVQSWIAWSQEGRAGVHFGTPVDPGELTQKESAPPIEITKDTREVDFRRPGFRRYRMTDEERKIVEEWNRSSSQRPEGKEPSSD